jgi:hypothetical protein
MNGRTLPGARLLTWLALAGLPACTPERYYGPYALEAPSPIEERSASRLFELPLSRQAQGRLEELQACEQLDPPPETPCACRFAPLPTGELALRVDYRLTHLGGPAVSVQIWVGDEVEPGAPAPDLLPDRPRVEVYAYHLRLLQPGQALDGSLSEAELDEASLAWSLDHHPECEPGSSGGRPAPRAWLLGLSLPGEEDARVSLELSVRVRGGG